jgi:hypothetical protein
MINFFIQFLADQKYYVRKKLRARTRRHHDRVRQRNMKEKKRKSKKTRKKNLQENIFLFFREI